MYLGSDDCQKMIFLFKFILCGLCFGYQLYYGIYRYILNEKVKVGLLIVWLLDYMDRILEIYLGYSRLYRLQVYFVFFYIYIFEIYIVYFYVLYCIYIF